MDHYVFAGGVGVGICFCDYFKKLCMNFISLSRLPDIFLKLHVQNKPRPLLFVVIPGICLF